jgi:hypothetical protein
LAAFGDAEKPEAVGFSAQHFFLCAAPIHKLDTDFAGQGCAERLGGVHVDAHRRVGVEVGHGRIVFLVEEEEWSVIRGGCESN